MGDFQGLLHAEEGSDSADHHGGHIDDQLEPAEFQDIVVNGPAVPDGVLDGLEVVVQDDDLAGLLGGLGAAAHGEAHIRPLQGRGVVDAVAGHAHHQVQLLAQAHHPGLVRGQGAGDDPDAGDDLLHLVVGQLVELGGGQRHIVPGPQQPGLPGDGHGGLQPVAGNHDHLDAGLLHLGDGLPGLGTHVVPDAHQADQHRVGVDGVLRHLAGGVAEGQHPHGLACQLVDLGVQGLQVQGMLVPIQAEVLLGHGQELLRRALVEGAARPGDVGLAELIGGVEALGFGDGIGGDLIQLVEGLLPQKAHQRLVRGVAAHHAAAAVIHGLAVLADGQIDQALELGLLGQLIQRDSHAVCGEELHHLQVALGNGARLVTEQDVQGAGGLDALRLADQHVVVQNLAGVLHQHQRDHQGQPLRLVVLHLLGHLAHHGGKAHLAHIQHALAVKQHGAPEQGVGVHEGVAGDVLRQGEGLVRRGLGAFLRLAVEGGVVHP